MIDLYTWITPNGLKISILLEELGLPYTVHSVDITTGEQFAPDFAAISPSAKIPLIVDRDTGLTLMESGAIMIYLADRAGRLLPPQGASRLNVIEWLMWQIGNLGPTLGHAHNFLTYNPGKAAYAEDIFRTETRRLYATLDARLAGRRYVAGDYSIADIAIWPWISRFERHKTNLNDFANVRRWYLELADRPAVQRGYSVPHFTGDVPRPA
ncbi:glutathione S-transferase N-terminal domain-containing protein [Mesorhizobium sp. M0088]|uniref:glutathione S-transferase family protein n=1 Tax=Mesorhizobium sp. M0088 TaxID=2956873 RepID=UPI00333C47BC